MNRNQTTRLVVFGLVTSAVMACGVAKGADEKPVQRGGAAVDYPLGLVAFASIERIHARATTVAENLGEPDHGEKLLINLMGGDHKIVALLKSPGLDTTKPIGAMTFPNWFEAGGEQEQAEALDPNSLMDSPVEAAFQGLGKMFVENATLVMCIPAKDRQVLLETIRQLIGPDDTLISVESQPGWHQFKKQENIRIGFVGSYLLLVVDDGEVKHFDRNYPDFDKLARSSLGKNGFVYALYRRGLPAIVRDGLAPAFKMAFAARFQQQDDEPEADFRLRTMFGPLQIDLLDLALSHVDEIRVSGHVDSATRTILVEPELVGPKDGKLARFFNGSKSRSSPFANLSDNAAKYSATVSLPLSQKLWKPVAEALFGKAQSIKPPEFAEFVRVLAKTVESGQLDMYSMGLGLDGKLFALRVAGNANLPEQIHEILKLQKLTPFDLAADSVEGHPIHRSSSGLSFQSWVAQTLIHVFLGVNQDLQGFDQKSAEVEYKVLREISDADGTRRTVTENRVKEVPNVQSSVWIAATPQAIWIGVSSTATKSCPDWFKTQIAASLAHPAGTANNSGTAPVKFMVRGLGASPDKLESDGPESRKFDIQPAAATDNSANGKRREEAVREQAERTTARGNILRDMPNAVRCEVRPTETGLKLSIAFEEAYFHWFATMIKDSMDEQDAAKNAPPEKLHAPPPPPKGSQPVK